MNTPAELKELIDTLGQQLAHIKTMLDILEREHAALGKRDLAAFDNIVKEKQSHLQTLEQLEPKLAPVQALLKQNDKQLSGFISQIQNPALRRQFQSLWNDLRKTLADCQRQNNLNNRVIQSSRVNVQQAIAILRGDNSIPNLYGATGKQDSGNPGHSIAVA